MRTAALHGNLVSLLSLDKAFSAHCVKVKGKKLPDSHRSVAWKPDFSSQFE